SVSFFLLFRRGAVLNIVFQKDDTRTLSIPEGVSSITQYAFWSSLIGVFMFLKAATEFLGLLTITLASKDDFSSFSYNGRSTWQSLIITLFSLLIVVKADFIASRLNVKKDE
ncbi:MAG: hypothetical protein KAG66_25035, partial [Methylococcales bacterium]|nr:hypothetical protein [Methylococcales bacterium]